MLVGWLCTAMLLQIQQELCPFFMRALIKQPPTRAFNAEPDVFSIHHLAHARERQSMKAQRLAMTRTHHINRIRRKRDNLRRILAQHRRRWTTKTHRSEERRVGKECR